MPTLTDLDTVRARLERDRNWSAFSLADLDAPYAAHAAAAGVRPATPHEIEEQSRSLRAGLRAGRRLDAPTLSIYDIREFIY